jgi:hypothetical protein
VATVKIDGGCHCGYITYEAEADPAKASICHCSDCQVLSGTAFRTVIRAEDGSFKLLSGEPTIYVKTADSGRKRAQAFCPRCGTPIYATAPRRRTEDLQHSRRQRAPARALRAGPTNLVPLAAALALGACLDSQRRHGRVTVRGRRYHPGSGCFQPGALMRSSQAAICLCSAAISNPNSSGG